MRPVVRIVGPVWSDWGVALAVRFVAGEVAEFPDWKGEAEKRECYEIDGFGKVRDSGASDRGLERASG